jgi:fatty acid amide hydrolase 2
MTTLTHLSAQELAAAIRAGETTARAVIEAHIAVLERIAPLHAVAAERFDAARVEADAADARVAGGEADLPPLLGVPTTIKEMLGVAGMPHSGGHLHRRAYRETEDATVVARLRTAGAIVLAVGNTCGPVPWIESNNPLYGRVGNAYDPSRTAGGSSGGDGAIVGSGGAPFAIGSDLGGSVRIPAYFNGVFGHLPSPNLVPLTGHFPVPEGEIRRMLYPGIIARRAEDLAPVLRLIAGPDGRDRFATESRVGDPDTVGLVGRPVVVSTHSSTLPLRPAQRHTMQRAADALAARGAEVRTAPLRQLRMAFAQFGATAAAEIDLLASWDGIVSAEGARLPAPVRLLARGPAAVLQVIEAAPARAVRTRSARRLVDAARRAQDGVAAEIGDGVLIYPPFPRPAPRHGRTMAQPWLATNTAIFNLYGMPVTQVPMGLAANGLPTGVQVAARTGNDHVTIAVARELERAFGGWVDPADV